MTIYLYLLTPGEGSVARKAAIVRATSPTAARVRLAEHLDPRISRAAWDAHISKVVRIGTARTIGGEPVAPGVMIVGF